MQLSQEMTALACAMARSFGLVSKEFTCSSFTSLIEELNRFRTKDRYVKWALTSCDLKFEELASYQDYLRVTITDTQVEMELLLGSHRELLIKWDRDCPQYPHIKIGEPLTSPGNLDTVTQDHLIRLAVIIKTALDSIPILKRSLEETGGPAAEALSGFLVHYSQEDDRLVVTN